MGHYNDLLSAYKKAKNELLDYMLDYIKKHDSVVVDDCFVTDKDDPYRCLWIGDSIDFEDVHEAFLSLKDTGRLPGWNGR